MTGSQVAFAALWSPSKNKIQSIILIDLRFLTNLDFIRRIVFDSECLHFAVPSSRFEMELRSGKSTWSRRALPL